MKTYKQFVTENWLKKYSLKQNPGEHLTSDHIVSEWEPHEYDRDKNLQPHQSPYDESKPIEKFWAGPNAHSHAKTRGDYFKDLEGFRNNLHVRNLKPGLNIANEEDVDHSLREVDRHFKSTFGKKHLGMSKNEHGFDPQEETLEGSNVENILHAGRHSFSVDADLGSMEGASSTSDIIKKRKKNDEVRAKAVINHLKNKGFHGVYHRGIAPDPEDFNNYKGGETHVLSVFDPGKNTEHVKTIRHHHPETETSKEEYDRAAEMANNRGTAERVMNHKHPAIRQMVAMKHPDLAERMTNDPDWSVVEHAAASSKKAAGDVLSRYQRDGTLFKNESPQDRSTYDSIVLQHGVAVHPEHAKKLLDHHDHNVRETARRRLGLE